MSQGKTVIIVFVALIIGFAGGFFLRPVIAPTQSPDTVAAGSPAAPVSREARGTQYFVAHIDEARQVLVGCRDGSVRGGECATAEEAIIKVDAAERRRKFLGN
ncbi:hypothetical protein [Sphingomonas aquatilis]|uniref:hypothetical protein n=1 Tax=Sphingomonas aquatilis TaxID=93063 RepID=UPI0023F7DBA6|nr:hypothetical protein [Sphingomonas aquatilis]MCI4655105.1 hypothetical protein [Sphingomonas aquatilis]